MILSLSFAIVITLLWAKSTLSYLKEWQDPRSVWFAATSKTADPTVYQNLGSYYLTQVDQLSSSQQSKQPVNDKIQELASMLWKHDSRLTRLQMQWNAGQHAIPEEVLLADTLRSLAWQAFDQSLQKKGNKVMPGIYYNRGLILLNRGNLDAAQKEFLLTLDEVSREPFAEVREQLTVYSHVDLGIIAWKKGNYPEALKLFRMAEDEQNKSGTIWFAGTTENRKQLERIVASQTVH
jgi:tetratricopeptide (TPR) repeat protein